ncbi:protein NRT1/ PTR FAMILY 5.9-like [Neltuma alba]|uniref:protein NRT1/ PTR FAMILY 5.9-like n=1 Tax=Neltuma alba TaxID=207710 RepID=UPI0010A36D81|nr:protein NRT1/ PTR FAMILY 5.9-like [Prosopis alba]
MGYGLSFSVVCCFVAWQVELWRRRLSLVKSQEDPNDDNPSNLSIMILTPQYFLLGLMEGFAEGGLESLLSDRLYSKSMKNFVEPCIEMLLGIGTFSSILFALMFHSWIKDDVNDSRLDNYFLVLASLSSVCLVIYLFYAKFNCQQLQLQVQADINH